MRGACLLGLVGWLCLSSVVRAELGEDGFVLHNQVSPDVFTRLLLWDHPRREWRVARVGEQPGQTAPILVVHLWADYCKPCRNEFPLLRDMVQTFAKSHPGQVEFVFLSETTSSIEMYQFLKSAEDRMPRTPLFQDTGEVLAQMVRTSCPSGQLTLPATLVLDEQRIVRHVVLGSMIEKRTALIAGITKLAALAKLAAPAKRTPTAANPSTASRRTVLSP